MYFYVNSSLALTNCIAIRYVNTIKFKYHSILKFSSALYFLHTCRSGEADVLEGRDVIPRDLDRLEE